uniref:Phosphate-regulating neutral endopeptidase n=1 Tax=Aceria tosichella TaxID=561515 RepID=A0A6G1S325_9ACAR
MMVDSAVMLGANRLEAEEQLLDALNFETALAYHSVESFAKRNNNKMKLSQLSEIAPNIDWNKYLAGLMEEEPLKPDEELGVPVPKFIVELDKLLMEVNSKTLANYMIWRVVQDSMIYLSKRWHEPLQQCIIALTGQEYREQRLKYCLKPLMGSMSVAISSMYVKNYFDLDSKRHAEEIADYIRSEFAANLNRIDWMDRRTRGEARLKAFAMFAQIGYPDELLNATLVEEH